jgi:hypothetical protein
MPSSVGRLRQFWLSISLSLSLAIFNIELLQVYVKQEEPSLILVSTKTSYPTTMAADSAVEKDNLFIPVNLAHLNLAYHQLD